MKTDKILQRIIARSGIPDIMEALTNRLSLSDLQSLLLAVYRQRTEKMSARDLFNQYQQNRFVQMASNSPVERLAFEQLAFGLLPKGFRAVELSPVAPLGANSIVATVDQINSVVTVRNTEVCSDNTNVMALECARQRRRLLLENPKSREVIKYASSHRLMRPQLMEFPGAFPHFMVFGLCSAGRDEGGFKFELNNLSEHIIFYLNLLKKGTVVGRPAKDIEVMIMPFNSKREALLEEKLMQPLSKLYPDVKIQFDRERTSGRGYYLEVGFQINARNREGDAFFLADGGFTDWTSQFLSNRKERLLISGIGSERFMWGFKR